MRFEQTHAGSIAPWSVEFIPDGYDGTPPLDRIIYEVAPRKVSADRFAVAMVLIAEPWIGAVLDIGGAVGPEVASAVEEYAGRRLSCPSVDYTPRAFSVGSIHLSVGGSHTDDAREGGIHTPRVVVTDFPRMDVVSGAQVGLGIFRVPSNVWLFGRLSHRSSALVEIASAVLFAEDLEADAIRIAPRAGVDDAVLARMGRLMGACRLGLIAEDSA